MKKVMFSAFALGVLVFSCQKEDIEVETNIVTTEVEKSNVIGDFDENIKNCVINDTVGYFLNGELVRPGTYDPANEDLFGIAHKPNIEEKFIGFYYFTNKEDYFQFGRDNGYANTLEGGYNFEKGMRAYIETNNVEEYYELNGDYPDGYLEYERNLYMREVIEKQDRGITWLFLNINSPGSTSSISGYKPFFSSSQYNNAISRYKQITSLAVGYGWMNVYDKKWYKKKIKPTIGHVTLWNVSFNGVFSKYDNKMSSCIAL